MAYRYYIVQTHPSQGGGSSAKYRVNPLAGQGLDTNMMVRCSRSMRTKHDLGTMFKIKAKVTDREGGAPFLDSTRDWAYEVISENEAIKFISNEFN